MNVDKFDAVILASGLDYPDALSGAYMAYKFNAPILLIMDNERVVNLVSDYIKNNLSEKGTIYVLGGEKAVSAQIMNKFSSYSAERLFGNTRYETNLEILRKSDVGNDDILICTGLSFADSLSASAVRRPVLLVKDQLTEEQMSFLTEHRNSRFYILGGENAVSTAVEEQAAQIHECRRLSGATRYETSTLIAEEFFESPYAAVLAYGENFPDGLCGGPLAIASGTPLILTLEKRKETAKEYCEKNVITRGAVLGGEILVSDETADYILAERPEETKQ